MKNRPRHATCKVEAMLGLPELIHRGTDSQAREPEPKGALGPRRGGGGTGSVHTDKCRAEERVDKSLPVGNHRT